MSKLPSHILNWHPILFSPVMVAAILAGRKSQTRRIVKPKANYRVWEEGIGTGEAYIPQMRDASGECKRMPIAKDHFWFEMLKGMVPVGGEATPSPFGVTGDMLWVRETHYQYGYWTKAPGKKGKDAWTFVPDESKGAKYADALPETVCTRRTQTGWFKRPAIHMPRWASRIALAVTAVRIERLTAIRSSLSAARIWRSPSGVQAANRRSFCIRAFP